MSHCFSFGATSNTAVDSNHEREDELQETHVARNSTCYIRYDISISTTRMMGANVQIATDDVCRWVGRMFLDESRMFLET